MLEIQWIVSFLVLGGVVGLMAGLLGVGGGGIMVPVLSSIFLLQGMAPDKVVHLALGSSMAAIIITSLSSLRAHHAKGGVIWSVVKIMAPGIVIGTFAATLIASKINGFYLTLFFALFMAYVSLIMLIGRSSSQQSQRASNGNLLAAGTGIGAISALVSIGGGSLTVPYLSARNIELKKAIGTSAAIGFPISVAGTLGYLLHGWQQSDVANYTFGYIYLPAVLLISTVSFITAPYGVKMAHYLPVPVLKKVFAVLLLTLSAKMLLLQI